MSEHTNFNAVQINTLTYSTGYLIENFKKDVMDELTEHLAMNGYTYDTNGDDRIFIYDEELAYLETILQDRNLMYTIL